MCQNSVDKPKINLFENEPQAKHISLFEVWNILLHSKFEMDFLSWQSLFMYIILRTLLLVLPINRRIEIF